MTVIDPLTIPNHIEGKDLQDGVWQSRRAPVEPVLDRISRVVAPPTVRPTTVLDNPPAVSNKTAASTAPAQRASERPPAPDQPVRVPAIDSGRKSLIAVMHWEGVVERVEGNEFRARLTPFDDGTPNPSRIEYTDFTMDDLANHDDRNFVEEGARFYWTLGRATNRAGTLTNVSLVRFRRLPPASSLRKKLAEAEADALLQYGLEP